MQILQRPLVTQWEMTPTLMMQDTRMTRLMVHLRLPVSSLVTQFGQSNVPHRYLFPEGTFSRLVHMIFTYYGS